MSKPFLILQLRPEDIPSNHEYEAFLKYGGLLPTDTRRVRMDKGDFPEINLADYSAIIVGGGPTNVSDPHYKKTPAQQKYDRWLGDLIDRVIEADFPYFGSCYGHGALALRVGSKVSKAKYGEPRLGAKDIVLTTDAKKDPITKDLPKKFRAFTGHKEAWQFLPDGVVNLARTASCPIQMVRVKKNIYGTQFHTELDSEGVAFRAVVYRHAGYFPPEDAEELIELANKESVTVPMTIINKFVERHRR